MFGIGKNPWGAGKRNSIQEVLKLPETLRSALVSTGGSSSNGVGLRRSSTYELESYGEALGEGNYGVVKLRRDRNTGEPRAVKVVSKPEHWDRARLVHEAEVLQNLDHPHILRLFGWHEEEFSITMVMEYCAGGELKKAVQRATNNCNRVHQGWAAMVFTQLFEGIAYCHDRGLIHRDLKSGNILLYHELPESGENIFKTRPHVVIADLGLAQIFINNKEKQGFFFQGGSQKKKQARAGTAGTMAPEVWKGTFGPKADIWSLGCVLYQMFTFRLPYMPADPEDDRQETWTRLYKEDVDWILMLKCSSEECVDMCKSLLNVEFPNRPMAKECLNHGWFRRFLQSCPKDKNNPCDDLKTLCQAICNWRNLLPMHRALCLKLASEATGTSKFAEIFSRIDTDNNGTLSKGELVHALAEDFGVGDQLAGKVAETLDYNRDGTCEYLEFAAACLSSLGREYDEMLWQEFCSLDVGGIGKLNLQSFNRLVDKLRPLAVSRHIHLQEIDTDGDGLISFSEFGAVFGRSGIEYYDRNKAPSLVDQPRVQNTPGPKGRGVAATKRPGSRPAAKAGGKAASGAAAAAPKLPATACRMSSPAARKPEVGNNSMSNKARKPEDGNSSMSNKDQVVLTKHSPPQRGASPGPGGKNNMSAGKARQHSRPARPNRQPTVASGAVGCNTVSSPPSSPCNSESPVKHRQQRRPPSLGQSVVPPQLGGPSLPASPVPVGVPMSAPAPSFLLAKG